MSQGHRSASGASGAVARDSGLTSCRSGPQGAGCVLGCFLWGAGCSGLVAAAVGQSSVYGLAEVHLIYSLFILKRGWNVSRKMSLAWGLTRWTLDEAGSLVGIRGRKLTHLSLWVPS